MSRTGEEIEAMPPRDLAALLAGLSRQELEAVVFHVAAISPFDTADALNAVVTS